MEIVFSDDQKVQLKENEMLLDSVKSFLERFDIKNKPVISEGRMYDFLYSLKEVQEEFSDVIEWDEKNIES